MIHRSTLIEAEFQLLDVKSGRVLWKRMKSLDKEGSTKVPMRSRVDSDWSDNEMKDLLKSKAANLPRLLANEALDSLPGPKDLGEMLFRSDNP